MQKIIIALLAITCVLAAPDYCSFFKAFGNSFVGAGCSSDLDTSCLSAVDAVEQLKKILGGDMNAYIALIADVTRAYSSIMNSVETCQYNAHINQLIANILKMYVIVMQHFGELKKDIECVIKAVPERDLAKAGECLGDFLKIITAKA